MINLYDKNEKEFITNGLVVLNNCKSCFITEENNGQYELEAECVLDSRGKWQYLVEGNVIKADEQLFRVYHKSKTLTGIKANARHIFYDLLDNLVEEVDIRALQGAQALDKVMTNTVVPHSFRYMSDINSVNDITLDDETGDIIDKNPVECIFKLIEIYGGELVRDNFNIKWLQQRGTDRGVLISYGKNIKGIEEDVNWDEVITRIKPVGADGLTLPEKFIDSPYAKDFLKIKVIEFSDCNSYEELRQAAKDYYEKTKCDIPHANYKVDFVELSKTEEYKDYKLLERVYVGDTVTVRHKKLKIDLKCKVIRIKKNVLTNMIDEVELGNFKPNLNDSFSNIGNVIDGIGKELVLNKSNLQKAIDNATKLLTNALGGYVVKKENEILIMDTQDEKTATKVWRWNLNGLGYSSNGVNGPYRTAITMDGCIVADFIAAGTFDGVLIKAGTVKTSSLELEAQQTIKVKVPNMWNDIDSIKKENSSTANAIADIRTEIKAVPGLIENKVSASISTSKQYTDNTKQDVLNSVYQDTDNKIDQAKQYAEQKSKEAKEAADQVAKAEAELARENAKAYADGKISSEEQARISEAQAKLNEAKGYAELKSNEAKNAAQTAQNTANKAIDDINNIKNNVVPGITERIKSAEQKITQDAIVNTVMDSITYYKSTLIPTVKDLKISRAGLSLNPLQCYNFTGGTVTPNNTLVTLEGGQGEYTPFLEGLNIYGSKVITFDKQIDRIKNTESRIEQQANKISLVVREDGSIEGKNLVAAINMSTDKINMSALNLDLRGYVTFTNLDTPGQTTIDGGNLKSHSVGADRIKVEELFVGKGGIRLESSAVISWEQVDNKPFIPRTAVDVNARPNNWTPTASQVGALPDYYSNRLTRLDANGLYTGTVDAANIRGNTFRVDDYLQFVRNGAVICKLGSNIDGTSPTGAGQLFLNNNSSIDVNPTGGLDTIRLRANRYNYARITSAGTFTVVSNGIEVDVVANGKLCGGSGGGVLVFG